MGITELEQDIKLIRKIMESSSRYTNIPASGYLVTGVLGVLGAWRTHIFLKSRQISEIHTIELWELKGLTITWFLIFVAAIAVIMLLSWRKARKHQITAWNSLAARMFLSQIPLVIVSGVLTVSMGIHGYYDLIPTMWLGIYGAILYSFSYFTGVEHKIEGGLFVFLSIIAAFVPLRALPFLLGIGFGGIHLMAGAGRAFLHKKGVHGSDPIK